MPQVMKPYRWESSSLEKCLEGPLEIALLYGGSDFRGENQVAIFPTAVLVHNPCLISARKEKYLISILLFLASRTSLSYSGWNLPKCSRTRFHNRIPEARFVLVS